MWDHQLRAGCVASILAEQIGRTGCIFKTMLFIGASWNGRIWNTMANWISSGPFPMEYLFLGVLCLFLPSPSFLGCPRSSAYLPFLIGPTSLLPYSDSLLFIYPASLLSFPILQRAISRRQEDMRGLQTGSSFELSFHWSLHYRSKNALEFDLVWGWNFRCSISSCAEKRMQGKSSSTCTESSSNGLCLSFRVSNFLYLWPISNSFIGRPELLRD